ncbi:MAG: hypothetical protein CL432_09430 [Acidimicrobiaceae bacterium]|nr:hypothetical protein [Acidimicrobiaceae bacterium]|tara:strand:+ start:1436 stop:2092 length:657 start_codon:yes stop_codon:yes gene_type:complete
MKILLAFVMAVIITFYPAKIVIQTTEADAAKIVPSTLNQPADSFTMANAKRHLPGMTNANHTGGFSLQRVVDPSTLISPANKAYQEIACLAKNIYFEAAVESTAGKLAVAHVTHNRVTSNYFPNTYCNVIYEGRHHANGFPKRDQCQFSWYCDGKHDEPFQGRNWRSIQSLATWFYHNDDMRDITDGATHYHADYINDPRWASYKRKTVKIDTHIFYR